MNNKELKEFYLKKTTSELRGLEAQLIECIEKYQKSITEESGKIAKLDVTNINYTRNVIDIANDIKSSATQIKEWEKELVTLKPILAIKETEAINIEGYDNYIKENETNIKPLIDAVEERKQNFITNGCKCYTIVKKERVNITITLKEAEEMFNNLLKETVMIIKNSIGDIAEVNHLKANNNKGFDCNVFGINGKRININTILAGGYNIQQLHYRTLVNKY